MRLENKIAVVTGGGSGFGTGIAERLAQGRGAGDCHINMDAAQDTASRLNGMPVQADVSRNDDMAALAAAVMDRYGRIDIFVNAGITHLPTPMDEIEEAEFERVLMVNTKSVYLSALFMSCR